MPREGSSRCAPTKLFCDSQAAAVDRIEEIQKKQKIDCEFRRLDGYLECRAR